jgi:hypothetical protein
MRFNYLFFPDGRGVQLWDWEDWWEQIRQWKCSLSGLYLLQSYWWGASNLEKVLANQFWQKLGLFSMYEWNSRIIGLFVRVWSPIDNTQELANSDRVKRKASIKKWFMSDTHQCWSTFWQFPMNSDHGNEMTIQGLFISDAERITAPSARTQNIDRNQNALTESSITSGDISSLVHRRLCLTTQVRPFFWGWTVQFWEFFLRFNDPVFTLSDF